MFSFLCIFILFISQQSLAASIPEEYEEMEIINIPMTKSTQLKQRTATGRVYTGNDCEYIKLCSVTANSGCDNGDKFVIKQVKGVRKQFLILNGEVVYGFVTKGKKFTECTSYTEVTTNVDCKEVSGLSDVDLSATATTTASGTKTDGRSAVCRFTGAGSGGVAGVVKISQLSGEDPAVFKLNITGLTPGKHGFHVHANGDLGSDCKDAGGHYNPYNKTHGSPTTERHVGDLGNVLADSTGAVVSDIEDSMATLIGDIDITGKAIVIHEGEDDLGQGGDSGSLATGNAGGRAGCCIIERN